MSRELRGSLQNPHRKEHMTQRIFVIYTTKANRSVLTDYSTTEWKDNESRYTKFYDRVYATGGDRIEYILAKTKQEALEKAK